MKEHIAHMVRDRATRFGSDEVFRFMDKKDESYKSYSWESFASDSEKIACSLISMGFGHQSRIGIFSDNRLEWTLADIGILSVRGVVVPFFGTASVRQVQYIVDETEMELMFAGNQEQLDKAIWLLDHSKTLKTVVYFPGATVCADKRCLDWEQFLQLGEGPVYNHEFQLAFDNAQPYDLATILYTSGTTGEPKGVMLGHDNFMECFLIHDKRLDITRKDVSLCFLPLSHIFERTWTFYLMHCGAVNVFLENPREVIKVLPLVNPTVMCTVPRFFEKTYDGIQVEKEKWPKIKQNIFNWAIATGLRCNEYKKSSSKIPAVLNFKLTLADLLVLKKLRKVFGNKMRQMPCAGAAIREDLLRFFHAAGLFVNYGYGATETTATVSCFKKDEYSFQTCGTAMPGLDIKFTEEGEIMVKGPTVFRGYYRKKAETEMVLRDGWYMTGDKGHMTKEGDLVMTDRLKDMFKTSVGKYVSPQKLELLLGQEKLIEQVIAVGDNRKFVSALIVPSFDNLKTIAENLGIDINDRQKVVSHDTVQKIFRDKLEELQQELTPYERVVKFTLLTEPFSIENNAMTSTLKLKRKVITEKHIAVIEEMYSS
ncbi:MAG: long-chain fatty acid--CoA ligase [Bacteroidales bacterium]|nr:long-chain fatty acid--CoA ligase [Bacteroidales bacterium]